LGCYERICKTIVDKPYGVVFDDLLDLFDEDSETLMGFISYLSRKGLVQLSKTVDNTLIVKPTYDFVDLIRFQDQALFKLISEWISEESGSKRIHPLRAKALRVLRKKKSLDLDDWIELYDYLDSYITDVSRRVIVLKREKVMGDEIEEEYLFLYYNHRFTREKIKEAKKKLKEAFKKAASMHKVGVHITLTMDPSKYSNLIEALIIISQAFNKFMSYLRKLLGFRPDYIKVLEPQDSGNPHLHVVIFGIDRIKDHYELTELLKKQGFGQIHYEYKIVNVNGKWKYAKKMRRGVDDYLAKYLTETFSSLYTKNEEKSIEMLKVAYYFASNRRFFTCSRSLLTVEERIKSDWIFFGVYYYWEVPEWILEHEGVKIIEDDELVWIVVPAELSD